MLNNETKMDIRELYYKLSEILFEIVKDNPELKKRIDESLKEFWKKELAKFDK